ncbi:MAG: 2-octaprenyl-6-methoxyphenyl hydroxylase [Rhodospirillaceae bacterium TMED8]|nr:2-octaprenyl-6-methoxyphenyl hydroxylase [Magnetovibrio sp.]OUT50361.1 MAG: 2-octaprenyl-6-methoxyphenyl hydroxylase [Rhodospirillaceae bacterium TMED8]|tara:strand:+ start:1559 stop:2812 length:1254 start_codon:yes stop_codon:yes gene_type:complete
MTLSDLNTPDIDVDLLIIGGGLVGSVLAVALENTPIKTCIIDKGEDIDLSDADFDGRAFAISASNKNLLAAIGLWPVLEKDASPILEIRVSDGPSLLALHFDHKDVGDQPMGIMLENRHLRCALRDRLSSSQRARVLAPASVEALVNAPGGVQISLVDGRVVRAQLVVGADGRGSQTRAQAGIKLTRWPYPQTGIVCTVRHQRMHMNIAHERFLPSGPFAILPLTGDALGVQNRSSIVWTERADLAHVILDLDEDAFRSELMRRFGDFLGNIEIIGSRYAYPLSLQFAERFVDNRLALVGDAAHGMHPIAGQGLNMGLKDVATLAQVLAETYRLGLDIGGSQALSQYAKWRRFDHAAMLLATDMLNRLFSNDIAPVRIARDVGLAAVNAFPPIKNLFMRHAMGVSGDVPKLLRGQPL